MLSKNKILLGAGVGVFVLALVGNSFLNSKVESEIDKTIQEYIQLKYDSISCSGLFTKSCTFKNFKIPAQNIEAKSFTVGNVYDMKKYLEGYAGQQIKNDKLNMTFKFEDAKFTIKDIRGEIILWDNFDLDVDFSGTMGDGTTLLKDSTQVYKLKTDHFNATTNVTVSDIPTYEGYETTVLNDLDLKLELKKDFIEILYNIYYINAQNAKDLEAFNYSWIGKITDQKYVNRILSIDEFKKIQKFLKSAIELNQTKFEEQFGRISPLLFEIVKDDNKKFSLNIKNPNSVSIKDLKYSFVNNRFLRQGLDNSLDIKFEASK